MESVSMLADMTTSPFKVFESVAKLDRITCINVHTQPIIMCPGLELPKNGPIHMLECIHSFRAKGGRVLEGL